MRQMLGLACVGALATATPAFSSDVVDALLKDAEKECRSFENGELTIDQDKAYGWSCSFSESSGICRCLPVSMTRICGNANALFNRFIEKRTK